MYMSKNANIIYIYTCSQDTTSAWSLFVPIASRLPKTPTLSPPRCHRVLQAWRLGENCQEGLEWGPVVRASNRDTPPSGEPRNPNHQCQTGNLPLVTTERTPTKTPATFQRNSWFHLIILRGSLIFRHNLMLLYAENPQTIPKHTNVRQFIGR